MKFLDKLGLVVFSVIVLLLSLVVCILVSGWLDIEVVENIVEYAFEDGVIRIVLLVVAILLALLALKCIFFSSSSKESSKSKDGILLENENGKLLVSKDTIENLTNSVVKTFDSAESVMTKVNVDEQSGLSIFITLFVYPDAVIKDLTKKIQTNVKDCIKKSLDLDVKEVNVRIKNITSKKETVIKE